MNTSSLTHFAQGLLMGGADIIPGVSGGTMALIVGIYRRLIDSISSFVSLVLTGASGQWSAARGHFRAVEWHLVLPLATGILVALGIGTQIIPWLLEHYRAQCLGFFFGLVAASVAIPWLRISSPTAGHLFVALAAFAGAFVLVSLPPNNAEAPSLLRVFASASVAICAMILPGVSGAFLLKVMGIYEVTLEAGGQLDTLYILVFAGGAAFGLGIFSKVLNWLIKHYHDITMAALVGLMAGGLRALWPWITEDRALQLPGPTDPVWPVVALAAAGFVFIVLLGWAGARRLEEEPIDNR